MHLGDERSSPQGSAFGGSPVTMLTSAGDAGSAVTNRVSTLSPPCRNRSWPSWLTHPASRNATEAAQLGPGSRRFMSDKSLAKAPVALFAYKRPMHLQQTLRELSRNDGASETDVVIFCDGPRSGKDETAVAEVRTIAHRASGFRTVDVVLRERNFGLAGSIIDGVSRLVRESGRVIVVEDDLVTSKAFLEYMNRGLDLYAGDSRVASIHGYVPPTIEPLPAAFFLRGADCWGWATWDRSWRFFEPDAARLLASLEERGLTYAFDLDGSYPYTQMLRDQIAGKADSWAIRWHASTYLRGMLTLHPGRSLVRNIGLDGSGVHCDDPLWAGEVADRCPDLNISVAESADARATVARFYRSRAQRPPAWRRWGSRLIRSLK